MNPLSPSAMSNKKKKSWHGFQVTLVCNQSRRKIILNSIRERERAIEKHYTISDSTYLGASGGVTVSKLD